ncbi:hypothetical protein KUTeg_020960 [Tegillarca granosa]|uniref:Uncharacterized protein n=1 Tax=Tegillarca granosa TaxID=220873 RepID=A0ABQ9E9F2_TEGGR|nr:hypothetical protein KUTeg_020960 [Tegillarca granosa]
MLRIVTIVTLFVALASAAPSQHCKATLKLNGLTEKFNETIAHAVHSMTVEGLKLFNSAATAINHIPTVNQDLTQLEKVLPHAPEDNSSTGPFTTITMNIIDKILSNLGDPKDGLGPNWSPIERVAHKFHMWDLWYKIYTTAWKPVVANPPSKATCECLLDVNNNGITKAVQWVADHYEKGTPITLLNRPIPKLTDAKSWAVWKDRLLHYYSNDALSDAAKYLYCATH